MMMKVYCDAEQFDDALALWEELQRHGELKPDIICANIALHAIAERYAVTATLPFGICCGPMRVAIVLPPKTTDKTLFCRVSA